MTALRNVDNLWKPEDQFFRITQDQETETRISSKFV
jgi:hypothetical protein